MERLELENERRRRPPKDKEKVVQCAAKRMLALVPATKPPAPPANQVQLAALAVDLNVRLRSADMPAAMQERVIRHARVLLDTNADNKRFNPTHLAMCLKKVIYLKILSFKYFNTKLRRVIAPVFLKYFFEFVLFSGIRCIVRTGLALYCWEEFRVICDARERWICVFFNRQVVVSSLQNRGPSCCCH